MKNFNVGDKVVAQKGAPYGITTNGWTGYVVGVLNNGNIEVDTVKERLGCGFTVNPCYFGLLEPASGHRRKFQRGDKVVAMHNSLYSITTDGWTGYVVDVGPLDCICVKKEINDTEYSYEVTSSCFALLEPASCDEKVVITFNRWETTARLIEGKKTTRTAIAKCHPKDDFNFGIGAETAVDRLFETPSPKIVKCENYEVGDKVKIVDRWTKGCRQNPDGEMDKWLGTIMTIKNFDGVSYKMEEDADDRYHFGWLWYPASIEGKVVEDNKIPNEPQKKSSKNGKNAKNKFKEGDIVVAHKDTPYRITTNGWTGYVADVTEDGLIGVRDEKTVVHYVRPEHFDLVTYKVIVTVDGNITTAKFIKNKEIIKTAIAKCHPKDDFNFEVGAKLAVKRLFESSDDSSDLYEVVKCDKYEVGDKVKIVDSWPNGADVDVSGEMNKWRGKVMTVEEVCAFNDCLMKEDNNAWYWHLNLIEGKVVQPMPAENCSSKIVGQTKVVKQATYKVGDRVKIVDKWTKGCRQNPDGEMDKWLGKIMTIRKVLSQFYLMEEDKGEYCRGWYWYPAAIEGKAVKPCQKDMSTDNCSEKTAVNTTSSQLSYKIVECDSYEVGDKVKIVDKWTDECCHNRWGEMDKWLGKIMTINEVDDDVYYMKEDAGEHSGGSLSGWYWNAHCIEGKVVETSATSSEPLAIGTVVCGIGSVDCKNIDGKTGVITNVTTDSDSVTPICYGVNFAENIGGHNCDCTCPYGHGWNICPKQLKVLSTDTKKKHLILMMNWPDRKVDLGFVGNSTPWKDVNGVSLFIGDEVEYGIIEIGGKFLARGHRIVTTDLMKAVAGFAVRKSESYKKLKAGDKFYHLEVVKLSSLCK